MKLRFYIERAPSNPDRRWGIWLSYGLGWTTRFAGTKALPYSGAMAFKTYAEAAAMKARACSQCHPTDRIICPAAPKPKPTA